MITVEGKAIVKSHKVAGIFRSASLRSQPLQQGLNPRALLQVPIQMGLQKIGAHIGELQRAGGSSAGIRNLLGFYDHQTPSALNHTLPVNVSQPALRPSGHELQLGSAPRGLTTYVQVPHTPMLGFSEGIPSSAYAHAAGSGILLILLTALVGALGTAIIDQTKKDFNKRRSAVARKIGLGFLISSIILIGILAITEIFQ